MKYLVEKDKRLRNRFLKEEAVRLSLRALYRNRQTAFSFKGALRFPSPVGSPIRLKNRCILTGRGGSVYSDFRLSRHSLREMALLGFLTGVSKSSW